MSRNLIDKIKGFTSTKTFTEFPVSSGVLDVHCGCMISKWCSIEFKKIFALDKDYLQVNIIYIEPFHSFDNVALHLEWDNVPANILKAYEISKAKTTFDESEGMTVMIVPYLYKNSRTTMKRFKVNAWMAGDMEDLHGLYVSNKKDIKKINKMFIF